MAGANMGAEVVAKVGRAGNVESAGIAAKVARAESGLRAAAAEVAMEAVIGTEGVASEVVIRIDVSGRPSVARSTKAVAAKADAARVVVARGARKAVAGT